MKLARLRITRELFLEAIPLPDDVLLLDARISDNQTLELDIEHKTLRDVKIEEGEDPPVVAATFTETFEVVAAFDVLQRSLRRARFIGWSE